MDKICAECRWYEPHMLVDCCSCPKNLEKNVVSGNYMYRHMFCSDHRDDGFIECRIMHTCGKEGRWWEAKN